MESDPIILNAEVPEVVLNASITNASCLRDLLCVSLELSNFRFEYGLKLTHAPPAEGVYGFNEYGRVLVDLLRNFALCAIRVSDACDLTTVTQKI
jgi:hypothetical protein